MATKVVHLGEQLESTNNRRVRGMEAQSLMHHLSEFQAKAKPSMAIFTDPSRVRRNIMYDMHLCLYVASYPDLPTGMQTLDVNYMYTFRWINIGLCADEMVWGMWLST